MCQIGSFFPVCPTRGSQSSHSVFLQPNTHTHRVWSCGMLITCTFTPCTFSSLICLNVLGRLMLSKSCLNKTIAQEGKRCENVKINIAALACKPVAGARQSSGCNCCRQFVDEGKSRRARARAVSRFELAASREWRANFWERELLRITHFGESPSTWWTVRAASGNDFLPCQGLFQVDVVGGLPRPAPICQGSCRSVVHNQQPFCPWPFGQPSLCCPSDSAPPA